MTLERDAVAARAFLPRPMLRDDLEFEAHSNEAKMKQCFEAGKQCLEAELAAERATTEVGGVFRAPSDSPAVRVADLARSGSPSDGKVRACAFASR